ncbi:quinone oxidoreductase, putative [Hepatocystis sp. ex Piliocolobus tephrosceles]|nr:quinone oxidoreductase, putative [Hepatocystis sp. ex Piliocolobus tephrosceles]
MRGVILKDMNELVFSNCLKKPVLENNNCNGINDLLIKVCAVGINRIDLLIKQNKYLSFPKGKCLGIEISGIIESSQSNLFKKNDKVCSLLKYNGYNEYVIANSKHTLKINDNNISLIEAASIPESFLTAYQLLYYIAKFPLINQTSLLSNENRSTQLNMHTDDLLHNMNKDKNKDISKLQNDYKESCKSISTNFINKEGANNIVAQNSRDYYFEKDEVNVLVYGALSSIGVNLLQLLSYEKKRQIIKINKIIAVTSNENKGKMSLQIGATDYVFHNQENFVSNVLNISQNVNLIFDCVGKSMFEHNLKLCTYDTVWILYGLLSGAKISNFNLFHLIHKRILLLSSTLYDRSDNYKKNLINSFEYNIIPLIYQHVMKFYIHKVLPIEKIKKAHDILEQNLNIGKVICEF